LTCQQEEQRKRKLGPTYGHFRIVPVGLGRQIRPLCFFMLPINLPLSKSRTFVLFTRFYVDYIALELFESILTVPRKALITSTRDKEARNMWICAYHPRQWSVEADTREMCLCRAPAQHDAQQFCVFSLNFRKTFQLTVIGNFVNFDIEQN
jgi:hypothetical protein